MVRFYDALKSGYKGKKARKAEEQLRKGGYIKDEDLSSHNHQVWYNDKTKDLLFNVSGTHNASDWVTDAYLAAGFLKSTNRYKEAHKMLRHAKAKYNPVKTNVTGHSLGGAIAGYIAGKDDEVTTFNKGATVGQTTRANETHYRKRGDIVSALAANDKQTKNIDTNFIMENPLARHSTDAIKDFSIFI